MATDPKAQAFKDNFIDIRNRDVEARAAYDPRFDKHPRHEDSRPAFSPAGDSAGVADPAPTPAGKVTVAPQVQSEPTVATVPSRPPSFDATQALFYGDSIATGLGHKGARGTSDSDAQWGRGAQATLSLLNNRPQGTFKGKDVVLSTGVLNSGADWDTVRSQVKFLQGREAGSIRLVGVPNTDQYKGWNDQLQGIADETGVIFLGGYTPGSDGVHMTDYSQYPVYR